MKTLFLDQSVSAYTCENVCPTCELKLACVRIYAVTIIFVVVVGECIRVLDCSMYFS